MLPHLGMTLSLAAQDGTDLPAAKTFVMALLYMSKPFPLTDLDLWVNPNSKRLTLFILETLSSANGLQRTRQSTSVAITTPHNHSHRA
jgi:hypothetical protein